jgi:plastocyanin
MTTAAVLALSAYGAGFASAADTDAESDSAASTRVEHYEGAEVHSHGEAMTILNDEAAAIEEILKSEELSDAQLEQIHEISYKLEDAVDELRAEEESESAALDSLDEAVQALHHASENHETEKTREWFAKLNDAKVLLSEPAAGTEGDTAAAENKSEYTIVIKDNKFDPETLTVPAGEKIKLLVDNQDATPEEFESHDMNREKIIAGNTQATIFIGPLQPGKYHYFGEFNMDSANGYIVAE